MRKPLGASLKSITVCVSQRVDHPKWQKIEKKRRQEKQLQKKTIPKILKSRNNKKIKQNEKIFSNNLYSMFY